MTINKGAMFGLDARIALAIFGALSVISGAALYSAIQHSKVVSAVASLNEYNKAVEAYILDVGENFSYSTTLPDSHLNVEELISSSKAGWKGPYLNNAVTSDAALSDSQYKTAAFLLMNNNKWAFPVEIDIKEKCQTSQTDCYYWTSIEKVDNALANAIDIYVDGSADRLSGNIRLVYPKNNSAANYSHVFFKGPPTLK